MLYQSIYRVISTFTESIFSVVFILFVRLPFCKGGSPFVFFFSVYHPFSKALDGGHDLRAVCMWGGSVSGGGAVVPCAYWTKVWNKQKSTITLLITGRDVIYQTKQAAPQKVLGSSQCRQLSHHFPQSNLLFVQDEILHSHLSHSHALFILHSQRKHTRVDYVVNIKNIVITESL